MKKLLLAFSILFLALAVFAQESKPNKEQTVNFIKQTLTGKNINHQWRYTETGTKWDAVSFNYKFTHINFDGCLLIIEYSCQRIQQSNYSTTIEDQPKITVLKIDFNMVESVSHSSSVYKSATSSGEYIVNLIFKQLKTDGEVNEIVLPFLSFNQSSYEEYEKKEDRVFKAFNHLRKLCGAPEPIKF